MKSTKKPAALDSTALIRKNLLLQKEIERKAIELEYKNRELQIEASLEKVRAIAMALKEPGDMPAVCKSISLQLQSLGVKEIRNVQTAIFYESRKRYMNYEYYARHKKAFITDVDYTNHKIHVDFAARMMRGRGEFFSTEIKGRKLKEWIGYQKTTNVFIDRFLESAVSLTYYWFSLGPVALGISTYRPLTSDETELFRRFLNVFELAYRRYLDVEKALAQARDAEMQLALERVRARSLAMHHTSEFQDVADIVAQQLHQVNIQASGGVFIAVNNEVKDDIPLWASAGAADYVQKVTVPFFNEPVFIRLRDAIRKGNNFLIEEYTFEEKNRFFKHLFKFPPWNISTDKRKKELLSRKGGYTRSVCVSHYTSIAIIDHHGKKFNDSDNEILKRFGNVFEQSYTRFLDLQKAEAQAREGQIQLALERVRARTMAMQKSGELSDAVYLLFQQFKELGEEPDQATIGIVNEDEHVIEYWVTMYGQQVDRVFKFSTDEPNVTNKIYSAWKQGKSSLVIDLSGRELYEFAHYRESMGGAGYNPDEKRRIINVAFFSKGLLNVQSTVSRSEENILLLERFAAVFNQTYTRFLDLQKAEAQAREAQIESALERVRSRTMAMHNSNDVGETVTTMFSEFSTLGIHTNRCGILIFNNEHHAEVWTARANSEGKSTMIIGELNLDIHLLLRSVYKAWAEKKSFHQYMLQGEDLVNYYDAINRSEFYRTRFDMNALPSEEFHSDFFFAQGAVFTFTAASIGEEHSRIIKRFAAVFGQTYRRYLDLQKAETSAKEAKMEAAMEKVRARAMAMQKPKELIDVAELLRREMGLLGIEELETSSIYLHDDATEITECWYAIQDVRSSDKQLVTDHMSIHLKDTWVGREMLKFYGSAQNQVSILMQGKNRVEWINYCSMHSKALQGYYGDTIPERTYHLLKFSGGYIGAASPGNLSKESWEVLKRATTVFSLAYTRFSDLQLAEAQAREAVIEAALERVRGKAMAMHNSNDLSSAASLVFSELRRLGIEPIRCGVGLLNKESRKARLYSAASSVNGDSLALVGWVELSGHAVLEKIYESWVLNEDYFPELTGDQLKTYYELLLAGLSVSVPAWQHGEKQYGHFFPVSIGCLYAWSDGPYGEADIKTLKRFATIIDLTFRRYLELQKSEINAKETVKQAALDRIRADIASMRTVSDLDRITPLIWSELTILGIPFIRCGVFIMDESQQLIHTFLSTPDGKAIGAFHLPYDVPNMREVVRHWRLHQDYNIHWTGPDYELMADILVKQGAIVTKEQYISQLPVEGFYLHFFPFLQGMLYVGNIEPLNEPEMKLIHSVAEAFSTAYARYEDFNRLEAAKKQVDKTLVDLKQAQQQLVQSEKMASLGELTAGIAHEIQNPLNFVNNFSEVNAELMAELLEEVKKGNVQVAETIADDIRQNLEKINHHGKRADSIVKGMLQHSRTSSGQKELTDINVLTDEYLRLAYHGLRAKDKSFNAKFETDFDHSIEPVSLIPQEIGRVILNLINNAFYAVSQRQKTEGKEYEPSVLISSVKINGVIEVKVKDNGTGISQKNLDKIFQPFFTTKPTGQGTGLGLSLAYDIVTKGHGGELNVESHEGKGSVFTISLPAGQPGNV